MRSIEQTLDAFSLKDLQSFRNIIMTLNNDGWTVQDAIKHVEIYIARSTRWKSPLDQLTEEQRQYMKEKYARLCPDCNQSLTLFRLKEGNAKNYKSVFRCTKGWKCISCKEEDRHDETDPSNICGYELFTETSVDEYAKEYYDELNKLIEENK